MRQHRNSPLFVSWEKTYKNAGQVGFVAGQVDFQGPVAVETIFLRPGGDTENAIRLFVFHCLVQSVFNKEIY